MSEQRFSLFPASFVHAGGTLNLTQLQSHGFRPGSQKAPIIPGGAIDRAHVGTSMASPVHSFSTRDLAGVFATLSATAGLACTGGATFRRQARKESDTFLTGSNHVTYASTKGFLLPRTLSASQDSAEGVMLTCEYFSLSTNGIAEPETINTGVDFSSAPTPAFSSRFFMGPIKRASTMLSSILGWEYDFGINFQPKHFDGNIFAECGSIITREPKITFTAADANLNDSLSAFHNVSGALLLFGRKGSSSSARVADATAEHLKVTVSAGEYCVDEDSVSGNDDGTVSFNVMPTGTVGLSVASAIA